MYAYFIKISKALKLPNLNIGLHKYIKIKRRKREAFYKRSWQGTSFFIVKMCASVIFQNVTLGNWDAIIYQGTKSFGWKNYFRGTKGEEKSWQILQYFFHPNLPGIGVKPIYWYIEGTKLFGWKNYFRRTKEEENHGKKYVFKIL